MIFYDSFQEVTTNEEKMSPLLSFNDRSICLLVAILVAILLWWYNVTCIGVTIDYAVDDYTNYRFMWEESE